MRVGAIAGIARPDGLIGDSFDFQYADRRRRGMRRSSYFRSLACRDWCEGRRRAASHPLFPGSSRRSAGPRPYRSRLLYGVGSRETPISFLFPEDFPLATFGLSAQFKARCPCRPFDAGMTMRSNLSGPRTS